MPQKRFSVLVLALFCTGLLALLWDAWLALPGGRATALAVRSAAALLMLGPFVAALVRRPPGWRGAGLAPASWREGWGVAALFTLGALAALAAVAARWGEPSLALLRHGWLRHYVPGTLGQQLALQLFLSRELDALGGARLAVGGSALLFAAFHAPNPGLVALTLPAGLFWTWHFRAHLNLPCVVASQLVLGGGAMALLGEGPLLHLRVGRPALALLGGG